MALLALVRFDNFLRVNRQLLIRIYDDAKQAGISLKSKKSSSFLHISSRFAGLNLGSLTVMYNVT